MKIGKILKRLREMSGKTQDEMAEVMHMSKSGYTHIEHDKGYPSLDKIEQIAKVFNMSTIEFLDFCENGATFFLSGDQVENQNSTYNYYVMGKNGHELLLAEMEKQRLEIQYKDELLKEKDKQIKLLEKLVGSLADIEEK
ncbi:helix-turn-helix domain-containing protein [Moraxella macacae]|nr:helix-turn-helix transcriptional regulator [Moraxella macacae]